MGMIAIEKIVNMNILTLTIQNNKLNKMPIVTLRINRA